MMCPPWLHKCSDQCSCRSRPPDETYYHCPRGCDKIAGHQRYHICLDCAHGFHEHHRNLNPPPPHDVQGDREDHSPQEPAKDHWQQCYFCLERRPEFAPCRLCSTLACTLYCLDSEGRCPDCWPTRSKASTRGHRTKISSDVQRNEFQGPIWNDGC